MLLVEENTSTISTISAKSKFVPKTSAKAVEINDTAFFDIFTLLQIPHYHCFDRNVVEILQSLVEITNCNISTKRN
jgi:hypothetical protein